MARLPRFFAPGVPLHVIQRGNDRQAIFVDADDHRYYRECLRDAARRHCVAVHAYVQMTNHVHFLMTPDGPAGIPRTMQAIGRAYVQWFNGRNRRTGTLWEGRYKAAIVDDEQYMFACMRYIELNPVRARMVADPAGYPWSSYHANACGRPDDVLTEHLMYRALGKTEEARRAAYREMFVLAIPESEIGLIRDATQHAWALGGASFQSRIEALGRRTTRLPRGRPPHLAGTKNRV